MLKVFGDIASGNCYKVKLLCQLLDIPHEWRHVDILKGDSRSDHFLQLTPNGKVPTIQLDDGRTLWESNAILFYLAQNSELLPSDPWLRAQVLQWQFFEQYSHEPYIAVARYINVYLRMPKDREEEFHSKQAGGHKALHVMEQHLRDHAYFAGNHYSIADISLYAYTHVADEGGFDLQNYPHIRLWLDRIRSHPKHFKMTDPV